MMKYSVIAIIVFAIIGVITFRSNIFQYNSSRNNYPVVFRQLQGGMKNGGMKDDGMKHLRIQRRRNSPPNKPSILVKNDQKDSRGIYGGLGDGKHLGGFLPAGDTDGMSANTWDFMMGNYRGNRALSHLISYLLTFIAILS